ncbi:zinc-binding protein A33-like [Chanos chanos]|uniref:Zinc-binding protein A33-like n=1 Tax=Chanos chanos TaxID=29144 RepID=A0A6J2WDC3_CHACN|nr:zinc-binding protein A33-like [Chanos chanos]
MASALSLQIQCPVCLCDFTDPVSLPCKHSYCRQCITSVLQNSVSQSKCPECRLPFSQKDIKTNRPLRNMVDVTREHLQNLSSQEDMLCPEHEDKLKLFCETDCELVCLICKEEDEHRGHTFKPAKEVAETSKEELKGALSFLADENRQLSEMIPKQDAEMVKTKHKYKNLLALMSAEFEGLHQFLREKEKEVKKHLEEEESKAVMSMQRRMSTIKELLKEGKEQEDELQSALQISHADRFLQWWSETGFAVVEQIKLKENEKSSKATPSSAVYASRLGSIKITPDFLTFGPFETHLSFFIWREMLRSIKPVVKCATTMDSNLKLSFSKDVEQQDGSENVFARFPKIQNRYRDDRTENLRSGQWYWEVDVEVDPNWNLGLTVRHYQKRRNIPVL